MVGQGQNHLLEVINMYFYVKNKTITKQMRNLSSKLLTELRDKLNSEAGINTQIRIVGSSSHNLVTRNGNKNPDVDYNLLITSFPNYDGRWVKETVRKAFNKRSMIMVWETAKIPNPFLRLLASLYRTLISSRSPWTWELLEKTIKRKR